jgi:hypothetical protein
MFEKKCEAFFVEHMQRASVAPRTSRITGNCALTLQSPSNYSDRASFILQSTAELPQKRILALQNDDIAAEMTNDLKTALLELAQEPDRRSTTARVAEHFAEIEAALNAGVQRTAVLETLNRYGITLSLKNFDNVLYRLRKKHLASTSENKNSSPPNIKPDKSESKGIASPTSTLRSEASLRDAETNAVALPEDWMTAKLTPAQFRLLSPKQSRAKIDAETAQYFPNRFKPKVSDS